MATNHRLFPDLSHPFYPSGRQGSIGQVVGTTRLNVKSSKTRRRALSGFTLSGSASGSTGGFPDLVSPTPSQPVLTGPQTFGGMSEGLQATSVEDAYRTSGGLNTLLPLFSGGGWLG